MHTNPQIFETCLHQPTSSLRNLQITFQQQKHKSLSFFVISLCLKSEVSHWHQILSVFFCHLKSNEEKSSENSDFSDNVAMFRLSSTQPKVLSLAAKHCGPQSEDQIQFNFQQHMHG